jgi:hypothetical protein
MADDNESTFDKYLSTSTPPRWPEGGVLQAAVQTETDEERDRRWESEFSPEYSKREMFRRWADTGGSTFEKGCVVE